MRGPHELPVSPFLWHESGTDFWSFARWKEILVGGVAVAVLGLVGGLTAPLRVLIASTLGGLAGWRLIVSLLLGYGLGTGATPSAINDILAGLTLIAVTALGHVDARTALTTDTDTDTDE